MESLTTARWNTWRKALPSPGEVTQTSGHQGCSSLTGQFRVSSRSHCQVVSGEPGFSSRRARAAVCPGRDLSLGYSSRVCNRKEWLGLCCWAVVSGPAREARWSERRCFWPTSRGSGFIQVLGARTPALGQGRLSSKAPGLSVPALALEPDGPEGGTLGSSTTEMKSLSVRQGHAKVLQCLTQPLSGTVSALLKGRTPLKGLC